jgi:hypothetical protein
MKLISISMYVPCFLHPVVSWIVYGVVLWCKAVVLYVSGPYSVLLGVV